MMGPNSKIFVAGHRDLVGSAICRALEGQGRSEEHTSELQSQSNLVCRLLLEKKKTEIQRLALAVLVVWLSCSCYDKLLLSTALCHTAELRHIKFDVYVVLHTVVNRDSRQHA